MVTSGPDLEVGDNGTCGMKFEMLFTESSKPEIKYRMTKVFQYKNHVMEIWIHPLLKWNGVSCSYILTDF